MVIDRWRLMVNFDVLDLVAAAASLDFCGCAAG